MPEADGVHVAIDEAPVLELLESLRQAGTKMQPVMKEVGVSLASRIARRMKKEVDPDNQPWPGLSISTILSRMRGSVAKTTRTRKDGAAWGDGAKRGWLTTPKKGQVSAGAMRVLDQIQMLRDSSTLAGSLRSEATGQGVMVGFGAHYAAYHEFGGEKDGRPHPPRRGLLMSDPETGRMADQDQQLVLDILHRHFRSAAHG